MDSRSFVAMLLRTGILCRIQERSFDSLRSLRIRILIGCVVNHNRPPLPAFFISVDFKGTLSCFRINTSGSVDSKGGYGRYYRTLCTGVDSKWLGAWGGTGCSGD